VNKNNKKIIYSNAEQTEISIAELFFNAENFIIIKISNEFVCDKCHQKLSFKKTEEYFSMLCGCGMRIFYPPKEDGIKHTTFISKKDYRGSNNGRKL